MHRELRRKSVTLRLLWEKYVAAHPGQRTYRYTQFCQRYRDWAETLKRSMRQQHQASEKLFADFAGQTVSILAREGGELRISDERDRRFRQRDRPCRERDRASRKAGLALRMTSITRAMLTGFDRREHVRAPDEHAHDQGRFTT